MKHLRIPQLLLTPIIASTLFILMFVLFAPTSEVNHYPITTSVAHATPITETVYPFLEYDEPRGLHDLNLPSFFNEFYGGGSFDGCCESTSQLIVARDESTHFGVHGASLRLSYTLAPTNTMPDFGSVAYVQSLFGDASQDRYFLNLDDFYGDLTDAPVDLERFEFYVRGSGVTTEIHTIRLQFKDSDNEGAWRDFTIANSDTTWTKISVPLDFSLGQGWNPSESGDTIDRTHLKKVAFHMRRGDNAHDSGVWYLDHALFVDEDLAPLTLAEMSDDQFLELVSKRSFQYFLDWYDWDSGMWGSRSVDHTRASIGLVGFGLSAMIIGSERRWVPEAYAYDIVTNTLTKLRDGQVAGSTPTQAIDQSGYRGFYWHFMDIGSGDPPNRAGSSELSSVDTALGMMGVVHARQHYSDDAEIVELADEILGRVEWKWFLDSSRVNNTGSGTIPPNNQTYLSWAPVCDSDYTIFANEVDGGDGCFSPYRWDYTTDEVMLINLLGIASPNPDNQVNPETFYAWQRIPGNYGGYDVMRTFFGSLFTYFFAQEWVDWGVLGTDNHPDPALRVNWEVNAQNAARANQAFVAAQYAISPTDYPAYAPPRWGLTVSDGPAERVMCGSEASPRQYCNYGAPPLGLGAGGITPEGIPLHDGTLQPYGSASMMHLVPDIALPSVKSFYSDTLIWRERFGLGDALNLNPQQIHPSDYVPHLGEPFYNYVLFDVDNSPIVMGIDNYRGGATRSEMMAYPPFRQALCLLFLETDYCVAPIHVELFEDLDESGTRDVGEGALSGWGVTATVRLTQTETTTGEVAATTSITGHALFQTYSNGDAELCLELEAGWMATTPTCQSIAIEQDGIYSVTFGAVTISEQESVISISALDANKMEGNSGTTPFTFILTRTGNLSDAVTVNYAVSGSAVNGADFVGAILPSGVITLESGDSQTTLGIGVQGDLLLEPNEAFVVTLSAPSGAATLAVASASGTIGNDDEAAALTVRKVASVATARVGEIITYTYRITNSGGLTFTALTALDTPLGSVPLEDGSLAPDEFTTGQLVHTVIQDDLPGPLHNSVTVTGTPIVGNAVVESAEATVELVNAAFIFTKTVGILDIEPECTGVSTLQVPISTTVVYCFTILNTGGATLTTHTLVDSELGTLLDGAAFDVVPDASTSLTRTRQLFATTTGTAEWTASYSGSDTVQIAALPAQANAEATVTISNDAADQDEDHIPDNIEQATDPDEDNLPNFLDDDSDGDGRLDSEECASLPCSDFDSDGIPDFLDADQPEVETGPIYLPSIGRGGEVERRD